MSLQHSKDLHSLLISVLGDSHKSGCNCMFPHAESMKFYTMICLIPTEMHLQVCKSMTPLYSHSFCTHLPCIEFIYLAHCCGILWILHLYIWIAEGLITNFWNNPNRVPENKNHYYKYFFDQVYHVDLHLHLRLFFLHQKADWVWCVFFLSGKGWTFLSLHKYWGIYSTSSCQMRLQEFTPGEFRQFTLLMFTEVFLMLPLFQ